MGLQFLSNSLEGFFYTCMVGIILTPILCLLRVYVRVFMIKSFGRDDVFLILAQITYFACIAMVMAISPLKDEYTSALIREYGQIGFAAVTCFLLASSFIKISLCCFFLRFLVARWSRYLIIATTALYCLYSTGLGAYAIGTCGPPSRLFENVLTANNGCGAWHLVEPLAYLGVALNAMTDWTFALLPISIIYRTKNMPRNAKISASSILGLALVASAVALVRIKYVPDMDVLGDISKGKIPSAAIGTCYIIELGLSLVCASLAALRPLLKAARRTSDGDNEWRPPRPNSEPDTISDLPPIHYWDKPGSFGIWSHIATSLPRRGSSSRVEVSSVEEQFKSEEKKKDSGL